ncbi:MAG: hydroxymethylbilane synthase [Planctomycetota bacterium]
MNQTIGTRSLYYARADRAAVRRIRAWDHPGTDGALLRRSRKPIVIASRRSPLARVQAEAVGRCLGKRHGVEVKYVWITSEGDRVRDRPLAELGGKALFTKAVDDALLRREADIAVHSLKDVPTQMTPGLRLAATPRRGSAVDVLITKPTLAGVETPAQLPAGTRVGTSSPRRIAQLRALNPDLRITLLRGNIDSRLAAVRGKEAELDATLLAAAGLERLGVTDHAGRVQDVDALMPAAAQGALATVCRADDHDSLTRCLPLNHAETGTAVTAERELIQHLGADCHSPIAVLCEPVDPAETVAKRNSDSHWFRIRAKAVSIDGSRVATFDDRSKTRDLRRLVRRAADSLVDQGAEAILQDAARAELFDAAPVGPPQPTTASVPQA